MSTLYAALVARFPALAPAPTLPPIPNPSRIAIGGTVTLRQRSLWRRLWDLALGPY